METGNVVKVLDHGYVRLVESMGSDLSIVRAARVSYDAAWRSGVDAGKDEKLIHYLMINRHNTPFEMVEFTFEIKAPIFVFRQWHRHRTWSYNEVSARYTELPEEFYVPELEKIGTQSKSSKQARVIQDQDLARQTRTQHLADYGLIQSRNLYIDKCKEAHQHYKFLLARGWPRELARSVLPVSTYSKMFAKVDLSNLFHFLGLRLHEHAQYEIRVYAQAMLDLIQPIVPVAVEAWEKKQAENTKLTELEAQIAQLKGELEIALAAHTPNVLVSENAHKYSH